MVLNEVKSLNKDGPSSFVGRLSIWSKTVVLRSPVLDALMHLYIALEF